MNSTNITNITRIAVAKIAEFNPSNPTSQDIVLGVIVGLVSPIVIVALYIVSRLCNSNPESKEEKAPDLTEPRPLPKSQLTEEEQSGVPQVDRIRPLREW